MQDARGDLIARYGRVLDETADRGEVPVDAVVDAVDGSSTGT